MQLQVLLVEADPWTRTKRARELQSIGRHVAAVASIDRACEVARLRAPRVAVMPFADPGGGAPWQRFRAEQPYVVLLLVTPALTFERVMDAFRGGAEDVLVEPLSASELVQAIERGARAGPRAGPDARLADPAVVEVPPDRLVGSSEAMRRVRARIARMAPTDATVLVTGESGTGKELVARLLHEHSPRHRGPFVAVNCAAIPADLLESELFGHDKGAFTDADQAHRGMLLEAQGGTFFLDEVSTLPPPLQPKLLRVLQERRVRAVGSNTEIPVDVRIIAATNQDLHAAAAFRRDLLYRLDVLRIDLPPLREREDDVLELAERIRAELLCKGRGARGFSALARAQLRRHRWPGNVRELENCIEAASMFAAGGLIGPEHLPPSVGMGGMGRPVREAPPEPTSETESLRAVEDIHVARVLTAVGGNKAAAARMLGISRSALYRKLGRAPASAVRNKPL